MKDILIYGAGAIGRGYVPWLFQGDEYRLSYVESNPHLCAQLSEKKSFTTHMPEGDGYKHLTVHVHQCFSPGDEHEMLSTAHGIITAVGPRHIYALQDALSQAKAPVVLFENDASLAPQMRQLTHNSNITFGVPDVITSNTAPQHLLDQDPLSLVTEKGTCFVDERAAALGGDIAYITEDELNKQWLAKLYIHNTPHCIAAYLGSIQGKTYLHEGMQHASINAIVKGAMLEMANMLIEKYDLDQSFVQWYSDKELHRFCDVLLYDPIARVAREPFRKLQLDNRLIGASQLALSSGVIPHHCITGIIAAIFYDNPNDPDYNIRFLREALAPKDFLSLILNMNPSEALFQLIVEAWDNALSTLKEMSHGG